METWPSDVDAWSVGQFTTVNGDNSPGGATGGNAWDLHLEQSIDFNLAFVSTLPEFLHIKAHTIYRGTHALFWEPINQQWSNPRELKMDMIVLKKAAIRSPPRMSTPGRTRTAMV